MLKSFLGWLRDYVINTGIVGLVEGVLGILAFGGILSALLGNTSIKAGSIVAVILGLLGLYILLIANRVEWRRRTELHRRLLAHYCDVLKERNHHSWRIIRWEQFTDIKDNGDASDTTTATAVVECDYLDFFSIRTGSGRVHSERERRKVKIRLRTLEVDGVGGTRWDATSNWITDSRLEVVAHFKVPPKQGDELTMVIDQHWPKKSATLVKDNEPDEFAVEFRRPISYLSYTIALPPGRETFVDPIGLVRGKHDYSLVTTTRLGRVEVTLTARDIPGDLRVGLRLDLKQRSALQFDGHSPT